MGVQQASLDNLQPEKYLITPESRALITNNSRKGIPNRKTAIRKWLDVDMEITDLQGNTKLCKAEDAVILAMIRKAALGSEAAATLLLDSVYGKVKNEPDAPLENTGVNLSLLNDAELKVMAALERKARGLPPIEEGNYVAFEETSNNTEPTAE